MTRQWHPLSRSQTAEVRPAIPASHNRLAEEFIYRFLVQWPMWSTFDRVWLRVDGPLPHPADGPVIGYMNHPSWWDGYMPFLLHREVFQRRFENYLMMDYQQLRRYRFFSWIGVFSVTLHDRPEAARSVAYIARLLATRQDRFFWIYPQGKITHNDQRPIVIHRGIARIARQAGGALLWPVALRYEFRGEERPEAFIRAGPAHYAPASIDEIALTDDVQQRLTVAVDALRDEVVADRLDGYLELVRGRPGINRIFDVILRVLLRRANV